MRMRSLRWAVPIVSLGTVVMLSGVTPAAAQGVGQPARHTYGPVTFPGTLQSVSAVSSSDVWAVGFHDDDHQASTTLVEHWNGHFWSLVATPGLGGGGGSSLWGVSAVSASDVWAAGNYYDGTQFATLVMHWDGTSWTVVDSPSPGGANGSYLQSVSARSANDVWAVGHTYDGTLIEHWDGSAWTVVKSPGGVGVHLTGVSAISATSAFAVGNTYGAFSRTFILHWNGKTWSRVASPMPGKVGHGDTLSGVSATSSSDAWAVGTTTRWRHVIARTLILHWDGKTWQRVVGLNPGGRLGTTLTGVSAISDTDLWAVGSFGIEREGVYKTFIEHWNGSRWKRTNTARPSRSYDDSAAAIDAIGPSHAWVAGRYTNSSGNMTMTQNWDGSQWVQL
jgi:hypothetical protein